MKRLATDSLWMSWRVREPERLQKMATQDTKARWRKETQSAWYSQPVNGYVMRLSVVTGANQATQYRVERITTSRKHAKYVFAQPVVWRGNKFIAQLSDAMHLGEHYLLNGTLDHYTPKQARTDKHFLYINRVERWRKEFLKPDAYRNGTRKHAKLSQKIKANKPHWAID